MNFYTVEGMYYGKVRMTVRAKNLQEALDAFAKEEEDTTEIVDPSHIEYNPDDVRVIT